MEAPNYIKSSREGMTTPCTGRVCNEDIDVAHFNVRVVIDAAEVLPFVQELCKAKTHQFRGLYGDQPAQTFQHNQITVLETNLAPVDREGFDHSPYRYGLDAAANALAGINRNIIEFRQHG